MLTGRAILLHLVGKVLCQRSHTSRHGHESEIPISALETSQLLCGVQNVFEVPVLSRKAWCTKLSSSHHTELAKTFITSASAPAIVLSPSGAARTQFFYAAMRIILRSRTKSASLLLRSFNLFFSRNISKINGELHRELLIYNIICKYYQD